MASRAISWLRSQLRPDTQTQLRDLLLEFGGTIEPVELLATRDPDAIALVMSDAFAFLLAACLDRLSKSELIWTIPHWLNTDLGHLDPHRLAKMTEPELLAAVQRLPKKPFLVSDAPRTIREAAALVSHDYGGNAELLWMGKSAREVQDTVMQIHGVGKSLAAMLVILLERCRRVRFPDHHEMGVKPDVHVQRVLYRLGLATGLTEEAALDVTQRMNPSYPGALDSPLWVIGTRWCSKSAPVCHACVALQHCARKI